MTHRVHVVVLTNLPKHLGDDVEVIVNTPRGNPWSFPFAHKAIMARHIEEYDLFIYSEDDTLITENNINAFLRATEVLQPSELAGFLRIEKDAEGRKYFPDVHKNFHWDPQSVVARGTELFAYFTNEHSACYLLTQQQLRHALQSGGFLVGPHQGKYDLLVSAATDPYTQCGFKKLVCISNIEDFVIHHLPNKYIGHMGVSEREVLLQVATLKDIANGKRDCAVLLNDYDVSGNELWCKNYYEGARPDLLAMIPSGTHSILSYGCGTGEMEAALLAGGYSVTAIPLDSVIGASAESRGLNVICGNPQAALYAVIERKFDCILLSHILPLVREPELLLRSLARLLSPHGVIITVVPNLSQLRLMHRRVLDKRFLKDGHSSERSEIQLTPFRTVQRWLTHSGLCLLKAIPVIPARADWMYRVSGKLLGTVLASEFVFLARLPHRS